jgi:hypothetical protein
MKAASIYSTVSITRGSSTEDEALYEINSGSSRSGAYERDQESQSPEAVRDSARGRDIHTFSNHPRKPVAGVRRPESAGNAGPTHQTRYQQVMPQPQTVMHQDFAQSPRLVDANPSFVRQPTGVRLPTPPPSASNATSTFEPSRSGKRLNLLNPMALLARRRLNQALPPVSTESIIASSRRGNHFNESFDPRIKGTVVHDFSAPRPKRPVPTNDFRPDENKSSHRTQLQPDPNAQRGGQLAPDESASGSRAGGNFTPASREDLEEHYQAARLHVRKASTLSDLPLPKPPYAEEAQMPSNSSLISSSGDGVESELPRKISSSTSGHDEPPPVPPKSTGRSPPSQTRRISIDPASTSGKSTPSKTRQSRKVSDVSTKSAGGSPRPRHMKSTSSRFSFDMIGAVEQERLLEDRHRQRALEKENEKEHGGDIDDFDEEFNMDDDDGLEERIPGVNADYDDEDDEDDDDDDDDEEAYNYFEVHVPGINVVAETVGIRGNENAMPFPYQLPLASPLTPLTPAAINDPRDVNGHVSSFVTTNDVASANMPSDSKAIPASLLPGFKSSGLNSAVGALRIEDTNTRSSADAGLDPAEPKDHKASGLSQLSGLESDDLYYDDGIIEELGQEYEGGEFDESVFDKVDTDEYGRPLKTFPPLPTLYSPPTLPADPVPSDKIGSGDYLQSRRKDTISTETGPPEIGLVPQPSISGTGRVHTEARASHLTQDTLAAYQSALAAAAFDAAASGKFRRDSVQTLPTPSEQEDPHPGLISDSSHTSHYEPFSPNYDFEDDFDYDDALEDDPIIAAANAEALANDMDGFYGQEFGFYSAPSAEAEYANGGYFGPRGVEGVGRSQSGRVASREPNLTPITERSEYSNRNSFMSLPMHGPGSVVSPGLAQLAGMLEYEGDMSLDALLKLRRGAWGGSQASLHSSNGSPRSAGENETSPIGQLPPWGQGGVSTLPMGGHKRQNSGFSGFSIPSEAASGVQSEASPTPASPTVLVPLSGALGDGYREPSKDDKEKDGGIRRHRYTGSAESISYSKEEDPQSPTGERWVLERRRTSEHGGELVGREVVSGGTI